MMSFELSLTLVVVACFGVGWSACGLYALVCRRWPQRTSE